MNTGMETMQEQGHSGLGVASFIISIISGICMFLIFVIGGIMETSTPGGIDENSVGAAILGLSFIALEFVLLVAIGLGIGGLVQSRKRKIFAILGTIFATGMMVGSFFFMLLGVAMEG